jgi:hypothetical protein
MYKNFYTGNITPEDDTIFVFGSNPRGIHGAGSAKVAREYFGAIYGVGEGLQGQAYALPTTDLDITSRRRNGLMPPDEIVSHIKKMYQCAEEHPDKKFKVAYRNAPNEVTLCGYSGEDLQKMFKAAGPIPDNVYFSEEWANAGIL